MNGDMETAGTAIVTGAASGVGLELVALLRAAGHRIVGADLSEERLADLQSRFPDVTTVVADVSTQLGVDAVFEAAGESVALLCNNAGIADMSWIDELTEERWDRVIDVNLKAPFLLTQRAVPLMVAAGGGAIVNTASISALHGGRAGTAYTAAKAGVIGLTKNVAATFGSEGIRCNAVCPGTIATNIAESMPSPTARAAHYAARDRDKPPPATALEVAEAIFFLGSPAAARINGIALVVDGGWTSY